MNLLIPNLPQNLSFSKCLSATTSPLNLHFLPTNTTARPTTTTIRMGGGPRTYPGGVSKWQWKRMQAKKAKQLLKARLSRERQIYEMRKRAELRAAVSELERPWEPVERAPTLFSVRADEQVKVLADRFQKPGGFDLWSDRDGPQLFETPDELPSARFFPKGVVHSVKPYRKMSADEFLEDGDGDNVDGDGDGKGSSDLRFLSEDVGDGSDDGECSSATLNSWGINGVNIDGGSRKNGRNQRRFLSENADDGGFSSSSLDQGRNGVNANGRMRKNGNGRRFLSKGVGNGSDNGESYPSSSLSYERNEGNRDGRTRRSGNGRRSFSKGVDDYGSEAGESSSRSLSPERNGGNVDGRMRKNVNGRRFLSKGVGNGSGNGKSYPSSSLSYERNGENRDGRTRRSGNGRRSFTKGVDDYRSEDGESSSRSLSPERNRGNVDGRIRKNGNGRRFMSKDVNRSDELYSGRVGSAMKHRGKYSGGARNGGKYSRGTSSYASRKVDSGSEVYDMDLHQDGTYGFSQKSEQSDSENW